MKPQPIMTHFGVDLVPMPFRRVHVWGRPTGDFVTLANLAVFSHFARVNYANLQADNDQ